MISCAGPPNHTQIMSPMAYKYTKHPFTSPSYPTIHPIPTSSHAMPYRFLTWITTFLWPQNPIEWRQLQSPLHSLPHELILQIISDLDIVSAICLKNTSRFAYVNISIPPSMCPGNNVAMFVKVLRILCRDRYVTPRMVPRGPCNGECRKSPWFLGWSIVVMSVVVETIGYTIWNMEDMNSTS